MVRVIPVRLAKEKHNKNAMCPVFRAIANELSIKPRKENRGKKIKPRNQTGHAPG